MPRKQPYIPKSDRRIAMVERVFSHNKELHETLAFLEGEDANARWRLLKHGADFTRARFLALVEVGFTESQAFTIICAQESKK